MAFTFQVLDDFRIKNLECKILAFTYSQKLRRITYPTFPHFAAVCLRCSLCYLEHSLCVLSHVCYLCHLCPSVAL
ncbi:hypothetical protein ID866_13221 [Astraeus odoratus]|nr:hypothetical protein ID866_13221 [Astraeus odoratus]